MNEFFEIHLDYNCKLEQSLLTNCDSNYKIRNFIKSSESPEKTTYFCERRRTNQKGSLLFRRETNQPEEMTSLAAGSFTLRKESFKTRRKTFYYQGLKIAFVL